MIYRFWLHLWYLWFTDFDSTFGILWPLCCLSFDLQILITPLVSCGHCVVCPLIYRFWLHLWYLWFTDSDYTFGIYDLQILITPLVSCGHCVVCPLIYTFWLHLWYLVAIVLSVLWFTDSDYTFGIYDLQILITPLVSMIYRFWLPLWYLVAIVLSVLWFTDSDYTLGIYDLQILITPLVSCGHCVVCPLIYRFWLPLWYLVAIVLSVLWFTDSDYTFGILWPLCCLSFDLQILITPLVSMIYRFWLHLWYLWFTDSDYPFGILWPLCCLSFDLQILITPLVSMIYRFWLPLWYRVAIVLSVLWFTDSDYTFGILSPLCCLSFDLQILITPLISLIYIFWFHLWYLVAIVLSVLIYRFWLHLWYLWFTDSDYLPLVSSNSSWTFLQEYKNITNNIMIFFFIKNKKNNDH